MLQLLLMSVLATAQGQAVTTDYYTAAVVELASTHRSSHLTSDEILIENAALYIQYISNASLSQVDIIVFPEGGLTGHYSVGGAIEVPSVVDKATPCDNTTFHQVLVMLSCVARQYEMYVVVTLAEIYYNTPNTSQLFTTSLVFDRGGAVIARYRKYHPYGKSSDKPPLELQYFETDFGVTFGMLISFDIQFLEPGVALARYHGIKHFVFPNCWVSALPFFTAVQTQWAWAYGLDVALLASGCNDPPSGGTGSGIYLGRRGALRYLQTSDDTSAMLVARVAKSLDTQTHIALHNAPVDSDERVRGSERLVLQSQSVPRLHQTHQSNSSLFLLRDYVDVYESRLLLSTEDAETLLPSYLPENSSVVARLTNDTSVCHNLLCCNFQITVVSSFNMTHPAGLPRPDDFSRYFYRMVAFDGVRSYGGGVATGGVQICGIISCINESMSSCALPADHASAQVAKLGPIHKVATVFEAVSISASLLYNNSFVYPDILVTGTGHNFGALVSSDSFTFFTSSPHDGTVNASLKMEVPISHLVTAAIYARQFDRDGLPRTELPSTSQAQSPHCIYWGFTALMFLLSIGFSRTE